MGQVSPPLSPQSQQLNAPVSVVASPTGTAVFDFQSPAIGFTWTGTFTCGGAPATAVFTAMIGGTAWGSWAGGSVYGPVQAFGGQQMVVTASGLSPGVSYELVWAGSSDLTTLVGPVWPDTNSSAQQVQFGLGTLVAGPIANQAAGTQFSAPVPPGTRTLILYGTQLGVGVTAPSNILCQLNTPNGFNQFYNQPPYLFLGQAAAIDTFMCVIPIVPMLATGPQTNPGDNALFTLTGPGVANEFDLWVFADTALYDESVFYNGPLQAASAGTGVVGVGTNFLTGPARVLSVSLSNNSTGLAQINYNGLSAQALVQSGSQGGIASADFGTGLILNRGVVLQLVFTGGAGQIYGSAVYAYP